MLKNGPYRHELERPTSDAELLVRVKLEDALRRAAPPRPTLWERFKRLWKR